ncbi:MAG: 5'-nucleotidase C-terminal domain-containing protein, partial [Alphaproteobacteria bacterium]|nr:5'-nucleotidase C-terminal domain-containing protein [Alphaproteobacteria bacterium]
DDSGADDSGADDSGADDSAGHRFVTFVHVNDLHAHLTPKADLLPDAPLGQTASGTVVRTLGGLARLRTLVDAVRSEAPDAIVMNIGDTYHGGAEALFSVGNAIVDPVNAIGFDVGVPGNWDFTFGPGVSRARFGDPETATGIFTPDQEIERPDFPHLAANVTLTLPRELNGEPFLPATMLLERGGVQVGLIGLTSDIVPMMYAPLGFGFEFAEGASAHQALVEQHAAALRAEGAELVVLLSELGIHKDWALANALPEGTLDVVFSAHTHEATFEPLVSDSGALVVEAGNDSWVGRMDLEVDAEGAVVGQRWSLTPITQDITPDPTVLALVEAARAPYLSTGSFDPADPPSTQTGHVMPGPLDEVVGVVDGQLHRRDALESVFNDAFTDLLRAETGADVAISPGFRFDAVVAEPGALLEDDTLADGVLRVEELYRFWPSPSPLAVGRTDGAHLREVFEGLLSNVYSDEVWNQGGGWVDGLSGVSLTVDLSAADGARVLDMQDTQGRSVSDREALVVAGCQRPLDASTLLCSHEGFEDVEVYEVEGVTWTPIELMFHRFDLLSGPTETRIEDTSGQARWPEAPFVQPLEGA